MSTIYNQSDTTSESLDSALRNIDWGIHYSYDVSGNVNTLVHEIPALRSRYDTLPVCKRIDYEYDLVSGKVDALYYQKNKWDQFIYKYQYDQANRLSMASTSHDGSIWDNDAQYFYHNYGPLARVELGSSKVQGIDYCYTIQAWLKAVNTGFNRPERDMGLDGIEDEDCTNNHVARDVFGYVLGYHNNDYEPVNSENGKYLVAFDPLNYELYTGNGLYNGNIAQIWSSLAMKDPDTLTANKAHDSTLLMVYNYDALNRLVQQRVYDFSLGGQGWANIEEVEDYLNLLAYDPAGNIETLFRNGYVDGPKGLDMDDLVYHYYPNTNRLEYIEDAIAENYYPGDIDDQVPGAYVYDGTGNLILDKSGFLEISWTIANKPSTIFKGGANELWIRNTYDGTGQRTVKEVNGSKSVYIRDARGNILAVYKVPGPGEGDTAIHLENVYLYGSSRLGEWAPDMVFAEPTQKYSHFKGSRHYELSNHLGNVMSVITDRKHGMDPDSNHSINYFEADVLAAQDYYPGGMLMPGRSYSSDSYRFGFNGKENDNEIKGTGNSQDYGMRIFDPDPLVITLLVPRGLRYKQ